MRWTTEQFAEFELNGILFVERLFSSEEVELLNAELPDILERPGPKNLTEQKSTSIRSAIAPRHLSDLFRRLSRHPRVINGALFLDNVTEFNGPTMFVPGTH